MARPFALSTNQIAAFLSANSCLFSFTSRECHFAHGGHLFAAVNGNAIQVFSMMTCECIATMRGHNGKACVSSTMEERERERESVCV